MKNYWCEVCNSRWQGDTQCPVCHEHGEIRETMSREEAEKLGLINE